MSMDAEIDAQIIPLQPQSVSFVVNFDAINSFECYANIYPQPHMKFQLVPFLWLEFSFFGEICQIKWLLWPINHRHSTIIKFNSI
jgi:hypothetical protein